MARTRGVGTQIELARKRRQLFIGKLLQLIQIKRAPCSGGRVGRILRDGRRTAFAGLRRRRRHGCLYSSSLHRIFGCHAFVHVCVRQRLTSSSPCSCSICFGPSFHTTWSAHLILSARGICAAIICSATSGSMSARSRRRCNCKIGEQATTTARSHKVSPPVSYKSGISAKKKSGEFRCFSASARHSRRMRG